MPSASKAQYGFMGLVRAVQERRIKPAEVRPGVRAKVERAAKSMTPEAVREYTATRTEGLPRHATGGQTEGGKPRAARSA